MNGMLTFGTTSALALTMISQPAAIGTSSIPFIKQNMYEGIHQITAVGANNSTKSISSHIQARAFNWHEYAHDLLGESRGFTKEEAKMHSSVLKSISKVKGKRFKI